eukprot:m.746079 g.746079  ORF g.746079 m.746079 type:complete len:50 (+) comp23131_c0_seq11:2583-2732(+)
MSIWCARHAFVVGLRFDYTVSYSCVKNWSTAVENVLFTYLPAAEAEDSW